MKGSKRLVISLHDVAPATWEACRRITNRLEDIGAVPYSLFVVPRFHNDEPIDGNADFLAWLSEQEGKGNEVLLHGYTHLVDEVSARGLQRVRGMLLSNGEEEFLHLDRAAFLARIQRGREMMTAAGFSPAGFVAPAWLMPHFGIEAVAECGFAYTETLSRMFWLRTGKTQPSPCVVFSPRTRLRLACSVLWNRLLTAVCGRARAMRVALHPADEVPAAMRELLRHIERQSVRRRCCTYRQLECEMTPGGNSQGERVARG